MDKIVALKIIVIGDTSVGKTSLLLSYTGASFEDNYISTIGVDYKEKLLDINNYKVKLKIMDTCGQERFKSLNKNFYSSADGIMFVFDVTQEISFKNIDSWLNESENYGENYKKVLVGNKIDLINIIKVNKEKIEDYAKNKEMIYFETSAKTGKNVEESFNKLAELIISNMTEDEIKEKTEKTIIKKNQKGKRKKCC